MRAFYKNLKQIRQERGLTQEQLAQRVNVTRQAVSGWEQGRTEPDLAMLTQLAEALEVDAEELIFGRKPKQYSRFQKKHLVCIIGCLSLTAILFLLQITVGPYWKAQVYTTYQGAFAYFWVFELLLPMAQPVLLGIFAVSFVRLFYRAALRNPWRKLAFLCGAILLLPAILVILDDLLANCIADWKAYAFFWLHISTAKLPPLQTLLFAVFPFASGVLLTLGIDKK